MTTDAELLRRYTVENSEPAFAELVARYLPLIYSAALRHLDGDAHLARDVAQQVFIALTRKAGELAGRETIVGWLYLGAHHAAAQAMRSRRRRHAYEREAQAMNETLTSTTPAADWDRVRPLLDDAMRDLNDRDREAVLLRYFSHRPFAEIGRILDLSEDAARMRVERALDKLRVLLGRQGVTSTTCALGFALQGNVIIAAPPGLAATITGSAFATATAGGSSLAGIFSANSHLASSAVATIAAVVAVGAALHCVREQGAAQRTLSELGVQRAAAVARLREPPDGAAAETHRGGDSPASAASSPVAAGPSSLLLERTPVQAGKLFLAAHPEAQRWIDTSVRGIFERNHGAALRALELAPEEYERLVADAAKYSTATFSTGGMVFAGGTERGRLPDPDLARIRELLGDVRAAQFDELKAKFAAKSVIRSFAAATYDSDVPLSPAQATMLSAMIDRHGRVERAASEENVYAIDWAAVSNEASKVLSAQQLQVFASAVAKDARSTQTVRKAGR